MLLPFSKNGLRSGINALGRNFLDCRHVALAFQRDLSQSRRTIGEPRRSNLEKLWIGRFVLSRTGELGR